MRYLVIIIALAVLNSCGNASQEEQKLEQLDKKSAREVTLTTVTQGDSVLHITKQHIWYNGEEIASKSDTIKTANAPKSWDSTDSTKMLSKVPIYVTVQ